MNLETKIRKVFDVYPQRTLLQNKSLHLYYTLLADAFNNAGYDIKYVLNKIYLDIPWTAESVKNDLWRPIQIKMLGKSSTTQLDTTEINEIYEALDLALRQRLGIEVDFPAIEQTQQYLNSLSN